MWVELEGIMLREVSHREEDKYCMLLLICGISQPDKQLLEKEIRFLVTIGSTGIGEGGIGGRCSKGTDLQGAWVAQSVKCPTLDFSSGHDLPVHEIEPCVRLCADSAEPAWDSLPLSLSLLCWHSLSQNK